VAGIPQYTSSAQLREGTREQLKKYFETTEMELWWAPEDAENADYKRFFENMESAHATWSRSKELSDFQFEEADEEKAMATRFSLIAPVRASKEEFGLLLMGRKKRRVYNLSDLELISQLIQQMQLSLNVLQLLQRERELLEKTYEANLTALRSQINPHFLFNTLNTISSLIHDSPDLAEEAVEKLAFIFRYTLRHSSQNLVSMENELSLVSTYLEIEKIRFGERLNVQLEMEPEVREQTLPAFVVQTLVENCIKHGVAKIIGKGIVSIDAYKEENYMICEIYDNGPGINVERINKGTGLNNILTRLEKTYNEEDLLKFENTGEGTLVRLKIPL
jgi:LytS/YehU family sensor histidine kinase